MTILKILQAPDARLFQRSEPFNFETDQQVIQDLKDTHKEHRKSARGIAAPHLGHMKRAFIMLLNSVPTIVCNPVITERSKQDWVRPEGDLSFPWINGVKINRPQAIRGTFQAVNGLDGVIDLAGWDARCFLHLLDTLDGITIEVYRRVKQAQREGARWR